MKKFAFVVISISLLPFSAVYADVVCKKPNSSIYIRPKCVGKEKPVDLSPLIGTGASGSAGAQGPQGPQGAQGATGASATIKTTDLHYTGIDGVGIIPSANPVLIRQLGTFNKEQANTLIRVIWNAQGTVTPNGINGNCRFNIRIDGNATPVGANGIDSRGNAILIAPNNTPEQGSLSANFVVPSLSVGNHSVGLYMAGVSSTTCLSNGGNFGQDLLIEEFNQP